ncbi:DUF3152 domain-containing protein [Kineosporia succinea]|uniref:DUF3152 domain-containing protein n=1 Tax=Kineosporia succinea TaxID=84632 RepID=A0ABT9PB64_9ACTN|nr:DUF3152 domain-containing protein [Kineosporia succinea]MDP9829942.1 hypothetical protein [Kineosporia succinea]
MRTIAYPYDGPGAWVIAPVRSRTLGVSGPVLRYQVAVEHGVRGVPAGEFARQVGRIFADARSWPGQGEVRLRQVGAGRAPDFTIRLSTPGTRDVLCGGTSNGYTSCRNGDDVVINVARWAHGVKGYPASLAVYRAYLINHETGHRLGHGHELCPGRGRAAPVMQQQTLGLHGCRANAWPTRNGRAYEGAPGAYEDPVPRERSGRR